jgi:tRNA A-37 threonylcarbamoyl transferase component Bud32
LPDIVIKVYGYLGERVKGKFFYIESDVAKLFCRHGLDSFDAIWNASVRIIDEPNLGRGGHSDVGLLLLPSADGYEKKFFLKRQNNHNCRTLRHPYRGVPLAIREWVNLQRLKKGGVVTMDIACVGRDNTGNDRALLVTHALEGYQSIGEWLSKELPFDERRSCMKALGQLIGNMHRAGLRHGCLYSKHIFISELSSEEIRFIDLEKCKQIISKDCGTKDIATFFRRTRELMAEDREHLLESYMDASPFNWTLASLQKKIVDRIMSKEYL